MTPQLEKKVEQSIKLLRSIPTDKGKIILAYSGGKDSDVCLELCKMAGIPFRAVYHSTTIDPPGTIKHVQDNNVSITRPNKTFFALMRENGFPSRYKRWCCRLLKEFYDGDIIVQGIRASESKKGQRNIKSQSSAECTTRSTRAAFICPFSFGLMTI